MSPQRRKEVKALLEQNDREFDALLESIEAEERNRRGEIMNRFVRNMLAAGDIDSKEADRITEEAEKECAEVSDQAHAKREEARRNYEHRIKQILSMR